MSNTLIFSIMAFKFSFVAAGSIFGRFSYLLSILRSGPGPGEGDRDCIPFYLIIILFALSSNAWYVLFLFFLSVFASISEVYRFFITYESIDCFANFSASFKMGSYSKDSLKLSNSKESGVSRSFSTICFSSCSFWFTF